MIPSSLPLVEVEPRIREYEAYMFWLLGTSVAGYNRASTPAVARSLSQSWKDMMLRCYDGHRPDYVRYGARGISVCKRWHQVDNYLTDVKALHGWADKLKHWEDYQLDKDYYSSNQYGPETCVWLLKDDNCLYTAQAQPVRVTGKASQAVYLSQEEAARATGVPGTTISRWLTAPSNQTTRLDLRFEYHITEHPLRRQLGGIIGTRRPYEEVTQASLGGSQC